MRSFLWTISTISAMLFSQMKILTFYSFNPTGGSFELISIWGQSSDLLPTLIKASTEDSGPHRYQAFRSFSGPVSRTAKNVRRTPIQDVRLGMIWNLNALCLASYHPYPNFETHPSDNALIFIGIGAGAPAIGLLWGLASL